ncbi:MAG: helix-turn-helix transcriptional regulator [Cytophagaceae bacterium]|nr:helix-turn-helix transcriptional regulator [Cytophagaceae bacterium]
MACPIGVMLSDNPGATVDDCVKKLSVARDIVDVIGGKWKMEIILALLTVEKRRFKELQKDLPGISSRVLSAALKDLEDHHILTRALIDTTAPITVEYALTDYCKSLKQAMEALVQLGVEHRREVIGR